MIKKLHKKGQEEMVGFAIIIGIVAIILLVFLWFAVMGHEETSLDDYKAESFLKASMEYTTDCEGVREFYSLSDLAFACNDGDFCRDGNFTCQVLESTISGILEESWEINEESAVKGYEFSIKVGATPTYSAKEGNVTSTSRGARETPPKAGESAEFLFRMYT